MSIWGALVLSVLVPVVVATLLFLAIAVSIASLRGDDDYS